MTSINKLEFDRATQAVDQAESILIVTHVSPDGDALGTLLGLANGLRTRGKSVTAAVDEGLPEMFGFLPRSDAVYGKLFRGEWDLMISVDASDEVRTGQVGQYGRDHSKTVINLDHHPTNTLFGDIYLIDSAAVSAAEVVFRWFKAMDQPLTQEIAAPLLTGMVTDTIGFRTNNVTSETLGIAQELMKAGASLTEVTARTLDNRSITTVNLWKHVLSTVTLHEGGVVTAEVTLDDFKRAGLDDSSDFGLVGFLININEAMIAAVFREQAEGEINLSMRAKPGFDVATTAFEVGGGGHTLAAGATLNGTLEEAKKRVLPMLKDAARMGKLVIA